MKLVNKQNVINKSRFPLSVVKLLTCIWATAVIKPRWYGAGHHASSDCHDVHHLGTFSEDSEVIHTAQPTGKEVRSSVCYCFRNMSMLQSPTQNFKGITVPHVLKEEVLGK